MAMKALQNNLFHIFAPLRHSPEHYCIISNPSPLRATLLISPILSSSGRRCRRSDAPRLLSTSTQHLAEAAGDPASSAGVPWGLLLQLLVGLPVALWTWKSLMLVIFQRRLVYLPYFPPGSRTQELPRSTGTHDHPLLVGLALHKIRFPSTRESPTLDGLLVLPMKPLASSTSSLDGLVFYLQGNAGNTLARLPVFRELLVPPGTGGGGQGGWLKLGVFALSPRGYWSSEGPLPFPFTALTRPAYRLHQRGVVADYARVLEELAAHTTGPLASVPIWVHGHSLGGAVAAQLLSHIFFSNHPGTAATRSRLAGLILENPLPSVPHMVKLLYPSRYVPYHYLAPFVRDTWDTRSPSCSSRASTTNWFPIPSLRNSTAII
ncbi:hypothetical protein PCANC_08765 [Puccinia coronata f. sp. avenae]|uniref:AB hydrolase-1 domain-containing protein n=1 Tax=Puccinia coronata f. sp. avenae TaxID=200324 RepID=A0A2N5T1Y9_9BASI|nr:hypothetical protein PCANC_08765 [Puccinia coronata f. sp. avenae]